MNAHPTPAMRSGRGDAVCLVLGNRGESATAATLTVDRAALGLAPGDGTPPSFSEVARGATTRATTDGDTGEIRLRAAIPTKSKSSN